MDNFQKTFLNTKMWGDCNVRNNNRLKYQTDAATLEVNAFAHDLSQLLEEPSRIPDNTQKVYSFWFYVELQRR